MAGSRWRRRQEAATAEANPTQVDRFEKTWIWGEGTLKDPSDMSLPFSHWFPGLGLIQLVYQRLGIYGPSIEVASVKRPPGVEGPFCKVALPAVIYGFTLDPNPFDISTIRAMTVIIDADPYIAACKCYAGTFHAMGFTRMKSLVDKRMTKFEDVDDIATFCQIHRQRIIAILPEGQVARIPMLSPEGMDILLSVTTTLPDTPAGVKHILGNTTTSGTIH